ncbi:MAG TPA: metallophosphoesterase family protein [Ktedonobacterales bacterium]
MRVAIISDIHGNAYALDAALADIEGQAVDHIICLGDAIQGGAQPAETVQRLRELGCPVVMGNADAWLLTGKETGNEGVTPVQEAVRQWSLARLTPDDQAFIAAFEPVIRVPLTENDTLLCFHGSPSSFDDIILPTTPYETVRAHFQEQSARWFSGGHTHLQQVRRIGEATFFNPGSIGVAYDHDQPEDNLRLDPWAEYAILTATPASVSLEFRRVPFPVAPLLAILRESDRPHAENLIREYGG